MSWQSGGDREEALRILREEVLPVWHRLKDDREIARTFARMAEVEQLRGDRSEALRILREEVLPVWQRLKDDREIGTVLVRIAEISEGANKSWCSPTGARPVRVRPQRAAR